MIAPKYRTDAQACSCPGYWYRRGCKHIWLQCVHPWWTATNHQGDQVGPPGKTPIVARFAGIGSPYPPTWRIRTGLYQHP